MFLNLINGKLTLDKYSKSNAMLTTERLLLYHFKNDDHFWNLTAVARSVKSVEENNGHTSVIREMVVAFRENDGRKWYDIDGHEYIQDGTYGVCENGAVLDCDGAPIDQKDQVHFDNLISLLN